MAMADVIWWLAAGGIVVAVAGVLVLALLRGGGVADAVDTAPDARVYAAQLAEIARDRDRGIVPEAEADRLRAEVARRLLATERGVVQAGSAGPTRLGVVLAGGLVLAGAVAGYLALGAPGTPDLPLADRIAMSDSLRAGRPAQAAAEAAQPPAAPPEMDAEEAGLVAALREAVAARPDDLQGHLLLAQTEARLGNLAAARAAQARVVAIRGPAATAADQAALARLSVAAAGGVVTPEADAALAQALAADPANAEALFLAGIGEMQVARPDRAFILWRRLIETAPADDPLRTEALRGIAQLAAAAGVDYVAPAARGPSAQDMAAAEALSAEDRQAMIGGMVEALAGRLAAEGGPAEDWAQLIRALAVLGQTDRARAIWAEAQTAFAPQPEGLDVVRQAAVAAGVVE